MAGPEDWGDTPDQNGPDSWGDTPAAPSLSEAMISAGKNLPSSFGSYVGDIAQSVMHPVESVENMGKVGLGLLDKAGVPGTEGYGEYADAVGKMYKQRYGGWDNFKKTLADDPVGIMADASLFLSGIGSGLRLTTGANRVANIASTAGRVLDPLSAPIAAARGVGGIAAHVAGHLSGVGEEAPIQMFNAAERGGQSAETAWGHLQGTRPLQEAYDMANTALQNMRIERAAAYRDAMQRHILNDPTIIPFTDIDAAFQASEATRRFVGPNSGLSVSIDPVTNAIRERMRAVIDTWRQLPPQDFHTPAGMDAMKKALGEIRGDTQVGTPQRNVANQIYNSVVQSITQAAPDYARIMRGYQEASDQLSEIERTLSLPRGTGPGFNATVDTALRKLQSILRNNVNTSYGHRRVLAEYLVNAGAPHLMEALAGQSMNPWFSRGLGRYATQIAFEMIPFFAGLAQSGGGDVTRGLAYAGATLPFMSPRLVGLASYGAGAFGRHFPPRAVGQISYRNAQISNAVNNPGWTAAPPNFTPQENK